MSTNAVKTEDGSGAGSSQSNTSPKGVPADAGSLILGRTLAALIDYVLLQAIMFACTQNFPDSDGAYYFALILGAVYLVAGNSGVMRGQTLGKKVFGLRVLSVPFDDETPYLSLSRSFIRYLGLYGGIMLLKEVPSLIYRANGVVASIYLLDAYMLPALIYPIALFASILIHPWQRGLHDGLASSIVVRSSLEPPQGFNDLTYALSVQKCMIVAGIGVVLGSVFWTLSVVHPPQVRAIYEQRFALEKRFPIRVYKVDPDTEGPHLHVVSLKEGDSRAVAIEVAQYLTPILSTKAFSQDGKAVNVLSLSFYRQHADRQDQHAASERPPKSQEAISQQYRYSFASKTIEEVQNTTDDQ